MSLKALHLVVLSVLSLASGVSITLEAEQLLNNGESLGTEFLNAGTHIYGVAGGPAETVTLELGV